MHKAKTNINTYIEVKYNLKKMNIENIITKVYSHWKRASDVVTPQRMTMLSTYYSGQYEMSVLAHTCAMLAKQSEIVMLWHVLCQAPLISPTQLCEKAGQN